MMRPFSHDKSIDASCVDFIHIEFYAYIIDEGISKLRCNASVFSIRVPQRGSPTSGEDWGITLQLNRIIHQIPDASEKNLLKKFISCLRNGSVSSMSHIQQKNIQPEEG
jgi:hypothetical protein